MIVADTDLIAALWINGPRTAEALRARRRDSDWIAPLLWRSEFRSVLRQHMLQRGMGVAEALWIADKAEVLMRGRERSVSTVDVLKLVQRTRHSAYDCEYVALAEAEGVRLVTGDNAVVRLFPTMAVLLEDFAAGA